MIVDTLDRIENYKDLPYMKQAVEYLAAHDLKDLPDGKTLIDGDNFYVMIQHPKMKQPSEARPEAHDKYADLQVVVSGNEIMGYAPRADLGEPVESRPDGDIFFYEGRFSEITFRPGMFAVFLPEDGHAPCIQAGDCTDVTKAVFKIKL